MLVGVLALMPGCGASGESSAPPSERMVSAASVRPSQESSTQFIVGLAPAARAEVTTLVAMSFTPETTYQLGDAAPITLAEALEILPVGKASNHQRVIWWGNALCEITYHRSNKEYVLDSVHAAVPHGAP